MTRDTKTVAKRKGSGVKSRKYSEDFRQGPGGWWGWSGNHEGFRKFELAKSAIISRSPWWIDYNHAPPGAGYLHMIFCLNTRGPIGEAMTDQFGVNGFVAGRYSQNFTNAELTFRLKGELHGRGAQLCLLVQATVNSITSGWVLTGQPLNVTPEWTTQTIRASLDPKQWVNLGGRHSRLDYYGYIELEKVLADVNCNIMLILFPLNIVPMGPIAGDRHFLRPGRDYPVWASELPEGYIMMDKAEISFPATK
jgi:hypothetical protein